MIGRAHFKGVDDVEQVADAYMMIREHSKFKGN